LRTWCIGGPKRDEVKGEWRKLHSEELHNMYSSARVIRIIKSRRMRWTRNVARMGEKRNAVGCWWKNQKERGRYENQDVGVWIILGWIL
jgi:hypothetical protein